MSQMDTKEGKNRSKFSLNLALATVAGQVGCVTLIIVVAALLAGLWLDNRLNTRPIFLATLLIGSVPLTIFVMLWIVRSVTSKMKPSTGTENTHSKEDANRGTDT